MPCLLGDRGGLLQQRQAALGMAHLAIRRGQLDARADRLRIEADRLVQAALRHVETAAEDPRQLPIETALGGQRVGMVGVQLERALEVAVDLSAD